MSAQPKFTPGPWEVRTIDGSIGTVEACSGRLAVAQAQSIGNSLAALDERRANAALIAAAPELLEALQELLRVNEESVGMTMSMVGNREQFQQFLLECEAKVNAAKEKAHSAIEKATGGAHG